MRYHELIERYKKRELDQTDMEKVERDIERQEAISEYLFDREESDLLAAGLDGGDPDEGGNLDAGNSADEFTEKVNRAVRRAFIRMGVIVGTVTLVIVLLITFALPKAVSLFYYDPGKIVGKGEYTETNQMSLDMAVYTELKLPERYRWDVQTEDRGFGDHDIVIYQNISRNGEYNSVSGRVEKGKLKLYDVNSLREPAINVFGWFQMEPQKGKGLRELMQEAEEGNLYCAAGDREQATETLKSLDENEIYVGYVTLDKIMDYEEFVEFVDSCGELTPVWCAPRVSDSFYMNAGGAGGLGFYLRAGVGFSMEWDREKYPDLVMWSYGDDTSEDDERIAQLKKEAYAADHFIQMLEYMAQQESFLKMFDQNPYGYAQAAEYVRENGLEVYGFVCAADKETLLKLNDREEVYEIYTDAE